MLLALSDPKFSKLYPPGLWLPGLSPSHNAFRHRLDSVYQRVDALSLWWVREVFPWHYVAWTLFGLTPLIVRRPVRLPAPGRRLVSLRVSRCCFFCCCLCTLAAC